MSRSQKIHNYDNNQVDIQIATGTSADKITTVTTNNANVYLLNGINAGYDSNERIGDSIIMRTLALRLLISRLHRVELTSTPTQTENYIQLILVYDAVPTSLGLPNFNDMFQGKLQDGSPSNSINSLPKNSNFQRFKILFQKLYLAKNYFHMRDETYTSYYQQYINVIEDIRLYNKTTQYNNDIVTDVLNINQGALYLILRAIHQQGSSVNEFNIENTSQIRLFYESLQ